MFFNDWWGMARTIIVGVLSYTALVLLLRVSGKRTLSKMNAFDLIVTVALGSTLATVLLSKDIPLAEGVLAFALLIGLQFVITWLSVRSGTISGWIKAEPTLLVYQGRLLHDAMRRERVIEAEVHAAVREQGLAAVDDVAALVLETDGTFSVLGQADAKQPSAISGVAGWDQARQKYGKTNAD